MPSLPDEANQASLLLEDLLGSGLTGVYLYGSAVAGGLRPHSDVDVLAVVERRLPDDLRAELVRWLLQISGRVGDVRGVRPLEVTVVHLQEVVPWRYPPRRELIYGEWMRASYERGFVPSEEADPDLAVLLAQARQQSVALRGPDASDLLDPVPEADLRRALKESLPALLDGLEGDERNVSLTLARMWRTATSGALVPKDEAASWALPRLPGSLRPALQSARDGYLRGEEEPWDGRTDEVRQLVAFLTQAVEAALTREDRV